MELEDASAISLAHKVNPTKEPGLDKFIPRIHEMLNGWTKEDPPTVKKLPVEVDAPEILVAAAFVCNASEVTKVTGDLLLIAFYYLLQVGEYTIKDK